MGSKIFYVQVAGKTALDSDTVIYVRRGSVATGHCLLRFATGVGLCTISDGTGTLAGFHLPRACHGRFVDPEAVALGRDVQLQPGLAPVGKRPVSERVARWLSSLSAKYIAVFALLVAVPVICTSVYLLYSSYRDNKRALTRLQQEKAKSVAVTIEQYFTDRTKQDEGDVGPLLVLHRTGLGASTPARGSTRPMRSTSTVPGARRSQARAAGSPLVKGNFLHDRSVKQASAAGVYFGPVYAPRLLSNPGARSMEVVVSGISATSVSRNRRPRNRSRWRDTRSQSHSGPCQADASRDVRIRLRDRRQRRTHRAPEQRRFHASFLGSSPGDEGARFVADADRRSAATSAEKRC